ncbi:nickel-binding protein [Candidatus Nitrosotenuis cloacae]|jgi:two-component system sensor histidine kinase HydH|uniref:nickel-binding protein n=1 Tax=Candidatus Nitrosotenuis cloacae TaxID=1603555 RepID=UPI00227F6B14|nr:nickel-binding protein [Candidatus Nitrosotenuis cloacae]
MPIFVDSHRLGEHTKDELEKAAFEAEDEFGVKVHQMLFSESDDVLYCVCEAPSRDAIINHHKKYDTVCDSIIETDQIRTDEMAKTEHLKAIGELAARISHDLRNPLSIIKNSLELIRLKNPEVFAKSEGDFEKINKATIRMVHLVDNVLDFVKPKPLHLESRSVRKIIQNSISRITVPDEITIDTSPADFELVCDYEKMEIVLVNLISNAIQAMGGKGGIKIRTLAAKNDAIIEIEDAGPGIPENLLPRIFDPLFTTRQIGTGLGLPSCKTIVEQHGGKIDVETKIGVGTTFRIRLPIKPESGQTQ